MKVTIRRFEEQDIENKVRWINDSKNNQYLHYELPLEVEKTRNWFLNNQDREDRFDAIILADNRAVGLIGLLSIKDNRGEFYVAIGEQSVKGVGVAKKASKLLLDHAENELGLEEIYLYTEVDNIGAQKLFESVGFIKRELIKNSAVNKGTLVDRYYYSIEL